jgi:hypothetical protein
MNDLPLVLCALAIVLTIVTLVGHGIWVLLAAIFGGGKTASQRCAFCGRSTPAGRDRCDWCGKDLASPTARELSDLEAVRRQLLRFREKGTMRPEVADRLLARLQDYRRRLPHVAAEKRAAPILADMVSGKAEPGRPAAPPPVPPAVVPSPEAIVLPGPQSPMAAHPPAPPLAPERPPVDSQVPPQAAVPIAAVEAKAPPHAPPAKPPLPAVAMPAAKPRLPAPPPRSWTEMLAAFMEQRNIRWGELIGGLLFVCSSVALVVSLRETLERIPYSKFFIFVSISSAVFGVGLYAHHRWKLESTSRALLLIATLLVPLNFVAMASMSKGEWALLPLASEAVSLAVFACLVGLAARILVPDGRWLTLAAVLGDSIAVLLAAQVVHADSPAWLIVGAGALPVALFAGAVGCYLRRHAMTLSRPTFGRCPARGEVGTEAQIGLLFTLLGITAFSTVVALVLVAAQAIRPLEIGQAISPRNVALVLQRLSLLVAMTAVPLLASGLTVMRGSRRDKELAAHHLAGTIVALVAMLAMLAALTLAWPAPGWLIAVAVLNTMALVFAAFRRRLPVLHGGAIACAALAYLTVFHLLTGGLTASDADPYGLNLLRLMISAESGTALGGLFLVLAALSELLARVGRRRDAVVYLGGCGVVAAAGLLLVTFHGVRTGGGDALRAAVLYAVYGAGSLALTARWRRLGLGYLGLVLVTSAAPWALWWQSAEHHVGPAWGAVLAIEALLMAAMAAVLQRWAAGAWYDPWKMFAIDDADRLAIAMPRSQDLSLVDMYRTALVHVAEAGAMLAAALTVWTAWCDRAIFVGSPAAALVVASAAIAAVYFLLAWLYRSPGRTWAASLIALAGTIHALNFNYFHCVGSIGPNWTIALLGHASLALFAVLCLDRLRSAEGVVRRAIGDPLANSALLSSLVVLPALIFGRSAGSLWLACCFPWLAAVWLALARRKRSVALFAAHQAALAFAALAATTVWLRNAGWLVPHALPTTTPNLLERIASVSHALLEPRNLQAYGAALGLLSLVWVMVRIVDLRRGSGEQRLLQTPYGVDWCIRHGVVVMQWLLVAFGGLAEVPRELIPVAAGPIASIPASSAFGPAAWILLGVTAVMLVATLWERWRTAELVAALLAAAALPCLISGRFATDLAVASASRWTLAVAFAVCSVAVWGRELLANGCRLLRAGPFAPGAGPPRMAAARVARSVLLATMVLPVLAITVVAAMLQIGGTPPGGPLAKTFFETLGPAPSYLVPLVLLIGALVGHALRERSSGYAFSAGLVLEMAVVLGDALHATLAKQPFDATFFVTLIQLFAITAAVWAIVWLIARNRLDVWREDVMSTGPWSRGLMRVQIGMAIVADVLVLGIALLVLAFLPIGWQTWSVAAGGPWGWIALVLPLLALRLRGRLRPHAVGLSGMAVLGLLACTVRALPPGWHLDIDPAWGYRTLMLGWAVYALLVVAATWWVASLRTAADAAGPPQGLIRMAAVWVRVAGILAVMLGLKAAFWQAEGEQLWAAATIAVASGAGATMAVWRRREGWAFAAALGVNLAASLVVWHFELVRQLSFHDYWLRLVQANVIASAAVAVVWLAARKRLYELRDDRASKDPAVGESPLLATQVLLPVIGNAALAVLPVVWLVYTPAGLPPWMYELAAPQGWIGLLLTAAVAAWYLRQAQPGSLLHVLGGFAVGAGVLGACCAASICRPAAAAIHRPAWYDSWIAYHVLTTAWAAAGPIVLAIALGGRAMGAKWLRGTRSLIGSWTAAIGGLTVAMATLHAFHDPARPWWAAGAILAVGLTAGLVAVVLRKPAQVWFSGLLINLAGTIVWWAYSPSGAPWPDWSLADLAGLAQANVLCLAIGSFVWSLVELLPRGASNLKFHGQPPFAHQAAQTGAVLLGLVTAAGVAATLLHRRHIPIGRLDWIALAGIVAATAVCLRQRRAHFPLPTLYGLGLSAIGLGLLARQLAPRMFCWSAADELAGYALAVAAIAWKGTRHAPCDAIHHAERDEYSWFFALQAMVMAVAGALALGVTVDFKFDGCCYEGLPGWLAGRTAAVPGLFLLLLAAIVMAVIARGTWRARWQYATLTMGVLLLSGLGWAVLAADGPTPWLHRSVIVMVAAAAVGLLAGFGLKRLLPAGSEWSQRGWQAVPVLAGLAIGMLAAVLLQESLLFELGSGVPMLPLAIGGVIVALAGLIAECLAFAVMPGSDPLRLSDRGRQAYVYAAETLAVAMGLHVWLTMPWLFRGYLVDYWMLIVMAVAFAGAGIGEWFDRRGVPVLAQPLAHTALLLPLLPAAGFWLAPLLKGPWHLVGRAPVVWFLMALFYGLLAVTRRSWKCAALAVLSANLGLWVGLVLADYDFLKNPQLFVIPVALAGLVAEYLNHDRLSDAQSAAFRYLTLSAIYISSTADMFIAGLGNSWGLPLVLMLLSVAGMLAGILFRVRSFLFLGLTFLVLDIMSMIWHAAHDLHHTWIWYVCGIVLGAAILAMFAVFEKRRNDVLAAVERLKDWAK